MSSVRKMQMLSEAEVNRLKSRQIREYDPEISAIARLETEIEKILNDTSKSETEKLAELRSAQLRSKNLRQQESPTLANLLVIKTSEPSTTSEVDAAVGEADGAEPARASFSTKASSSKSSDLSAEEQIMLKLPANKRAKAQEVLNEIAKHSNLIKLDPQTRRLKIGDEEIEGSNIIDIFSYAYSQPGNSKIKKPAGLLEFLSALKTINVPQSLITRSDAFNKLDKIPPGKATEILRLYKDA